MRRKECAAMPNAGVPVDKRERRQRLAYLAGNVEFGDGIGFLGPMNVPALVEGGRGALLQPRRRGSVRKDGIVQILAGVQILRGHGAEKEGKCPEPVL